MIEKILIFFLFLGPLVFFHELGHFLFARLFGVRVEVFSIGFGPKLFKFKKGDTQYAFSLIPLGGYVKMFGDDPLSEEKLTPEEEKVAYTKKGKWARFWIVFGGPLANFILAFFIYFALVMNGEKVPQAKFGVLDQSSKLYELGFRTGDVLSKINQQEIVSFDDLNFIDTDVSKITVNRDSNKIEIPVNFSGMDFIKYFSQANTPLRAPVVVNSSSENFLISNESEKILSYEEVLASNPKVLVLYQFPEDLPVEFKVENINLGKLKSERISLNKQSVKSVLKERGLYPRDLFIKNIMMGSAAETAKLKSGDIIVGINGEDLGGFSELKNVVQNLKGPIPIKLNVLSQGQPKEIELTPSVKEYNGKKVLSIGVESGISFFSFMVTTKSKSLLDSIYRSYVRTEDGMIKTFLGFKKLITGEVSLNNVGGPIAIGQVASESFNISLSMFFRLMAIISINLGIINLFPIPVLDGGHIVFIFFELINGGPLSRKKLIYAQQLGMSLLFLLIFVALFNDISRFF